MVYTPGVARVSQAIADDPDKAWALTNKEAHRRRGHRRLRRPRPRRRRPRRRAARDGGKGDAVQGVRRGRRLPHLSRRRTTWTRSLRPCSAMAPGFGGINLEDIAAPRCFEVEQRLRDELDIPVFHDDQHGTAIVVLAALVNALRVVRKTIAGVKIVTTGCRRRRHRRDEAPARRGGDATSSAATRDGALHRGRPGLSTPRKLAMTPADQPATARRGIGGRRARGCRRLHRPLGSRAPSAERRDREAWPRARSSSRSRTRRPGSTRKEIEGREQTVIATGRSRLPEPDQQRASLPRRLPRRARRAGPARSQSTMELAAADALAAVIGSRRAVGGLHRSRAPSTGASLPQSRGPSPTQPSARTSRRTRTRPPQPPSSRPRCSRAGCRRRPGASRIPRPRR